MTESAATVCPNCGTLKDNRYCPNCGQNDRDYNKSLLSIIRTLVKEVFDVDSRVSLTVKEMFLHPGQLTLEFANNRRASYSTPIRVYLVASVLYFFIVALTMNPEMELRPEERKDGRRLQAVEEVASYDMVAIRDFLAQVRSEVEPEIHRKINDVLKRPDQSPSKIMLLPYLSVLSAQETKLTDMQHFWLRALVHFAHAPENVLASFVNNLPLCMLVLLPWFALVLKLLYIRKGTPISVHLVYAMHTTSFSFFLFAFGWLLILLTRTLGVGEYASWLFPPLLIYAAGYNLVAMHVVYKQGWGKTTVKYVGSLFLYSLMLGPAFGFVALITILQL